MRNTDGDIQPKWLTSNDLQVLFAHGILNIPLLGRLIIVMPRRNSASEDNGLFPSYSTQTGSRNN